MRHILALDASTKRTGFAIWNEETGLVTYGAIPATSQKVEKRIIVMRDYISKLMKDYNIDTVIIEDVRPDNINLHTNKILTWLQGIIAVCVYEANPAVDFQLIGATTWRSILRLQGSGVKRETQKARDIKYVNDHFENIELAPDQDDEADAICIAQAYVTNNFSVVNSKIKVAKQEFAF